MSEPSCKWRVFKPTTGDLEQFYVLEAEVFGEASWGENALEETCANGGRALICSTKDGGDAVGMLLWRPVVDEAELLLIGVLPKWRRCGVGQALFHALIDDLPPSTFNVLHLEVRSDNAGAIDFYERQGFAVIGRRRRYYSDGSDAILMAASLA